MVSTNNTDPKRKSKKRRFLLLGFFAVLGFGGWYGFRS